VGGEVGIGEQLIAFQVDEDGIRRNYKVAVRWGDGGRGASVRMGRNSRSSGYASNPSRSKSTKTASVDTTELR
jgi:hypothetical protein